ncbi:MAG: glycosyltransferase 87 family protein, partial [Acidimicrobiia bacterium]
AVVFLAAIVVAPHDSHDLWSYAMYGRIVSVHHASPWVTLPAQFRGDPFLTLVAPGWRHTTSIYGPAFTFLAAAITKVGSDSATAVRMLFTSSFALAAALGGWIIHRRTRSAAAVALVVLHPAIAIAGLSGGHNDVLVGVSLLGAVVLAQDDRPVAAGFAAGLATLVKLTGGIGIVALACWGLRHRGPRWSARFAAGSLGFVALAYLPFGTTGLSAFVKNRGSLSRASAWQLPRLLTGLDQRHTGIRLGLPNSDTQLLVTVGAGFTLALVGWLAFRMSRAEHPAIGMISALGGYLFFAPYVLPWYPAWVIPTIGLVPRVAAARLLALQAALLVVVYELKTQSLATWVASIVWWGAVVGSVGLAIVLLRTLRRTLAEPAALPTPIESPVG